MSRLATGGLKNSANFDAYGVLRKVPAAGIVIFLAVPSVIKALLELCDGAWFDPDCEQESTVFVLGAHPTMKEADIWRTANELIRDYGADAENCARFRAEKLRQEGIPEDAQEWLRVADAIAELKRKIPGSDDALN